MDDISPRLKRLDHALMELSGDADPMLLSQLDGLVAGVLIFPDLVLPGEWLPLVWGGDQPVFDDVGDAQRLVGMVMEHYNAVSSDLHRNRGRYAPVFDVDTRNNDVLWELWMDGFESAMALRPESWEEVAAEALMGLTCLIMISNDEGDLPKETAEMLTAEAPDLIPAWIETLAALRLEQYGATAASALTRTKIGRNKPCPCGSGKKCKKCCGLN
ncbi:UPF0149 family protein [Sphingomonas oryzagri]